VAPALDAKHVPPGGFFPKKFLDAGAYAVEFFSEDVGALFDALLDARRAPKYGDRRQGPIAREGNRISQDEQTLFKVIVSTVVPSSREGHHAT
jgi:hypothetical protein